MSKKLGHAGATPHIPFRLLALCRRKEIEAWENQTKGLSPVASKVQKILASLRKAIEDEHRVVHGKREGDSITLTNWSGEEQFWDLAIAKHFCFPSIMGTLGGQGTLDALVITPNYIVGLDLGNGNFSTSRILYVNDGQHEAEIEVLDENVKSVGEALEWAARFDNLREYVEPITNEIVNCNLLS